MKFEGYLGGSEREAEVEEVVVMVASLRAL
jgi:hypothetical protein